ncbi:MAG: TetR/AcrR family transcriptional regulator [Bacteroidota bacterium]
MKNQILEKAEALFLKYGLKSVTMDDIARKLGISKKTLYQYVENKTDLIMQTIVASIEEEKAVMRQARESSNNSIEEMLKIARYAVQQLRQLSPALVYDLQKYYQHIWSMVQRLHKEHGYQMIKENIERGKAQGVYRSDINADILAKMYVMNTFIIVDEEEFPLKKYNKENLFLEFIQYHIHGIASPKGLSLYEKHMEGNDIQKEIVALVKLHSNT